MTRPEADARALADALTARGIEPVIEPLLQIRFRPGRAPDLEGAQALLVTSANGARACAAASPRRDLPVLAVGDATARAARELGYAQVESAGGDVDDLTRLAATRLDPARGPLVHAAGSEVAGDLAGRLGAAGFVVRRAVLYDAEPVAAFSPTAASLLREGGLDFAVFFSPRTAAHFAKLAAALPARTDRTTALCLSPAVAERIRTLSWRVVVTAAAPTQAELLSALDVVLARRHHPRRSHSASETTPMTDRPAEPGAPKSERAGEAAKKVEAPPAFKPREPAATPKPPEKPEKPVAGTTAAKPDLPPPASPAASKSAAPAGGTAATAAAGATTAKPGLPPPASSTAPTSAATADPAPTTDKGAKPGAATAAPRPSVPPTPARADNVPARSRGGAGFWPLAVLVLVLVALGASPFWAPLVAPALPWGAATQTAPANAALDERVAKLEARPQAPVANADELRRSVDGLGQRVQKLEERLTQLESRPAAQAAAGAAAPANDGAVKELADRLARLEQQGARGGLDPAALKELGDRLGRAEQQLAARPQVDPKQFEGLQTDTRKLAVTVGEIGDRLAKAEEREAQEAAIDRTDQALLLAVGQLRDAVRSSRPYAGPLASARTLAKDRPEVQAALEPLAARAEQGVPPLALLQQRFPRVGDEIVRSEQRPVSGDWADQALAKVRSLVTVRRVGEKAVEGGAEATVAAAETALGEGDLAGAVSALRTLQGPAAEPAQAWLADAQARLDADAAVDRANGILLQRMTQGGKAAPASAAEKR